MTWLAARLPSLRATAWLLTGGLLAGASAADAQVATFVPEAGRSGLFERTLGIAVAERPQPEFDQVPLRVGSFRLLPTASVFATYDDNVRAVKSPKDADGIITVLGTADLASDWSRHQVRAFARGEANRYLGDGDQNYETWAVGTTGRLDVLRGSTLQAGAQVGRNVVSRLSARSALVTQRQITYFEKRGFVGGTFGAQRIRLLASAQVRDQDYGRITALDEQSLVDFADRRVVDGYGRVEYALSSAIFVFVQGALNDRTFRNERVGTPTRDSHGYEVTGGANFDLGALFRGEVALGYRQQDYKDPSYQDSDGLAYHAQLQYFPTRLVTVTASADREVEDAALVGVGAFVASTYTVRADYEALRWLIVTPEIGYGNDRYQGLDVRYHRYFARLQARYTFSPRLVGTARYTFDKRDASGTGPIREFTVNRVQAGLTYRF